MASEVIAMPGLILEAHGLKETKGSIANKRSRGTIAATFLLAALEKEEPRLRICKCHRSVVRAVGMTHGPQRRPVTVLSPFRL
jgi:hypothetical protein